ncbi:MAG: hypothetical protein U5K54_20200 [Cytophagales bacterium]|nr:hypothetical protein [Cytophagales bacterium]
MGENERRIKFRPESKVFQKPSTTAAKARKDAETKVKEARAEAIRKKAIVPEAVAPN